MPSSGLLKALLDNRAALLRYLVLRGAAADEAEDILQDLSLKLSSEAVGPVAQPRAYVYQMANNHFLTQRRAQGRRIRREEDWVDAASGDDRERDERPSVEATLIVQEQLGILQRVMDHLPERTRTIFRRFRIDGVSQRLIAADISISVSAVEKQLARAYKAIASAKLRLDGDHLHPRRLSDESDRHDF